MTTSNTDEVAALRETLAQSERMLEIMTEKYSTAVIEGFEAIEEEHSLYLAQVAENKVLRRQKTSIVLLSALLAANLVVLVSV